MNNHWDVIIEPKSGLFDCDFKESFKFYDLLLLLIKRDIVTIYKQTILGPIWYFIQPVFTTIMFTFVFGKLANISTDGVPHIIFYLLGITIWNYFSECLAKTSNIFIANQGIFGKVYFPRIVVPASIIMSNLGKFFIQFALFLIVLSYYYFTSDSIHISVYAFSLPLIILIMATLGMGLGLIFSSMTAKYRDLTFLLRFGVQLFMYASPVIYPFSVVPDEYKKLISLNPLTPLFEAMRYSFFGSGDFNWGSLVYSLIVSIFVLFVGIIIFTRVEKNFVDTV